MGSAQTRSSSTAGALIAVVTDRQTLPILPPPVSVLASPDVFRVRNTIEQWVTRLKVIEPRTEMHRISASRGQERVITATLLQASLFTPQVLVWIHADDRLDPHIAGLLSDILPQIPTKHFLVVSAKEIPSKTTAGPLLAENSLTYTFAPLSGSTRTAWIAQQLKQDGVTIEHREVVDYLSEHLPQSLDHACRMIEQLALTVPEKGSLSLAIAREFIPGITHTEDFALLAALTSQEPCSVARIIEQLMSQGSNPFLMVNMVARHIHHCLSLRSAYDQGKQLAEVGKQCGIAPWQIKKYSPLVERVPASIFMRASQLIVEADLRLKGISLDDQSIVEELCITLSALMAPAVRGPR